MDRITNEVVECEEEKYSEEGHRLRHKKRKGEEEDLDWSILPR